MKAIELAKVLYPALSKADFIQQTCPDTLLLCGTLRCLKQKKSVDEHCVKCWDREVSEARAKWLIEAHKMCKYVCD